jgi:hypothetical protein
MRGGAVHGAVFDECRNMVRQVWTEVAMPMLARTRGWAWFNSTPRGHDWFWQAWNDAESRGDWARFHFTTYDNPHIAPQEVERMRASMTEREFRQEVLAEFLTDGGLIFRGVNDVCSASPEDPRPKRRYIIGADFALRNDNTVFSVFDIAARRQVHEACYRGVDSLLQANLLAQLAARYNYAVVVAEINSMGEPISRLVADRGVDVVEFMTTAATKKPLIDAAILAFEGRTITLLDSDENRAEFSAFEMKPGGGAIPKYGAPEGMHDDRVIAAALAVHGMSNAASSPGARLHAIRSVAF